jgi:hypothetical protein
VNLQNAPEAPAPAGLAGALAAVTNPNAFRDMTGLAGTQTNAAAAFQTAATLASSFGAQAASLKLAESAAKAHATQTADQKLASVQRAADKNLIPASEAQRHATQILDELHAPSAPQRPHQDPTLSQAIFAASGKPGSTIQATTPEGQLLVSLTDGGGGGGTAGAVSVEPFPATPYAITLVDNPVLNTAISSLASDPALKDLCVAVIDLSGDPSYAGFNDDDMLYVGSLQKISAMYAAFELRSRVQQHAKAAVAGGLSTAAPGWRQTLFDDLKAAWQPKLDAAFPSSLPKGFPKLADIFTISNTGEVSFSSSGQTQDQLDHIDGAGSVVGLKFLESLKLMVRWSNNHAAAQCILALSYPYINGVLKGAGFFDPGNTGASAIPPRGLWISGNYADISKDWLPDATANDANAGQPKTPRWTHTTLPPRAKTNFVATARQVARLLALVEQDALVDARACAEMRALMSAAELHTRLARNNSLSYVELALREGGRQYDNVFSKIGIGDDGRIHDCAIVERTVSDPLGDIKFRYAVAGLGAPNDLGTLANPGLLLQLFTGVDKAIKVN